MIGAAAETTNSAATILGWLVVLTLIGAAGLVTSSLERRFVVGVIVGAIAWMTVLVGLTLRLWGYL